MNFEDVEDSIRERLEDCFSEGIQAKHMEDSEAEVARPVTMPQAVVCFFADDYDPAKSTAEINQEETATFVVMITARKRRGSKGIYDIYNQCKLALLGWIPEGCIHKIQFKKFQFELNENGWFTYGLYLETKGLIVEHAIEPELPIAKTIDFENNITA
jgi:hypothetical protein